MKRCRCEERCEERAFERAAIVQHMRSEATLCREQLNGDVRINRAFASMLDAVADAVERGEHRKGAL